MKSEHNIIISQEFPKKVIPLIKRAKKNIDIVVYDWRWYPNEIGEQIQIFNNAIFNANQRGVEVKAVVQSRLIKEIVSRLNIPVKKLHSKKLLHTKLMIIDDEVAIMGSHNYTKNAFNLNYEVSIIVRGEDEIKRLKAYFENLFYSYG